MRLVEIRSKIRPNNSPTKLGVAEAANFKNYKTRMPAQYRASGTIVAFRPDLHRQGPQAMVKTRLKGLCRGLGDCSIIQSLLPELGSVQA
jgi:hypothetical protein